MIPNLYSGLLHKVECTVSSHPTYHKKTKYVLKAPIASKGPDKIVKIKQGWAFQTKQGINFVFFTKKSLSYFLKESQPGKVVIDVDKMNPIYSGPVVQKPQPRISELNEIISQYKEDKNDP